MLVSFDIKFIRRDKKQRKTGEACRASPTCFWSSLINLISKTYVVFYLSCFISRFNGEMRTKQMKKKKKKKKTKKKTQYYSNLLTSRMLYDINR